MTVVIHFAFNWFSTTLRSVFVQCFRGKPCLIFTNMFVCAYYGIEGRDGVGLVGRGCSILVSSCLSVPLSINTFVYKIMSAQLPSLLYYTPFNINFHLFRARSVVIIDYLPSNVKGKTRSYYRRQCVLMPNMGNRMAGGKLGSSCMSVLLSVSTSVDKIMPVQPPGLFYYTSNFNFHHFTLSVCRPVCPKSANPYIP